MTEGRKQHSTITHLLLSFNQVLKLKRERTPLKVEEIMLTFFLTLAIPTEHVASSQWPQGGSQSPHFQTVSTLALAIVTEPTRPNANNVTAASTSLSPQPICFCFGAYYTFNPKQGRASWMEEEKNTQITSTYTCTSTKASSNHGQPGGSN